MKHILTLLIISLPWCAIAHEQTLLKVELRKQQLIESIAVMQDSIVLLDRLISQFKLENALHGKPYMLAVMNESTIVKADYEGKIIDRVNQGDTIKIYDWKWWDLLVEYKLGQMGYIGQTYIVKNDQTSNFIHSLEVKARENRTKEINADNALRESKQKQEIQLIQNKRASEIKSKFKKYGSVVVDKIINEKIWIGMTPEMAVASWGNPEKVNKTVSSSGIKEQWVYPSDYLYFKEGILRSFQSSR